jgi:hypothetical protein
MNINASYILTINTSGEVCDVKEIDVSETLDDDGNVINN